MDCTHGLITKEFIPAINLFITNHCNMRCRFCFGSCKIPSILTPIEQRRILNDVIHQCYYYGIKKVTFVGGEPLLYSGLDTAIQLAHDLGLTTCVVSNGALVSKKWLFNISPSLDWIGLSIDSLSAKTNKKIGRVVKNKPISKFTYIDLVDSIHDSKIQLKINTTVCYWNFTENMTWFYRRAAPKRLKFFQALTIDGINDAESRSFSVSDEQFAAFVNRHTNNGIQAVVESSSDMIGSYLMVSPDGRLFDNTTGRYRFSRPICNVGFDAALEDIILDTTKFIDRGGSYNWTR
ncbi:viperin family antiviral radical SAM protein [Desulfomicrobium salsuginis]